MLTILRNLFLPISTFLVIAGLGMSEWSKTLQLKRASVEFHKNSELLKFSNAGTREWQGNQFPTYRYNVGGETREFTTHLQLKLPADGRVRMGLDPLPRTPSPYERTPPRGEVAVPINGPDTPETIYKELRGNDISEDYTRATIVTLAALIAGIVGYFLQKIIFREVGRSLFGRI